MAVEKEEGRNEGVESDSKGVRFLFEFALKSKRKAEGFRFKRWNENGKREEGRRL